jgi:hypothetical protein
MSGGPSRPHTDAIVGPVYEHLDAYFDRMEKGLQPIWRAQAEVGRTIITLSSGALVLSITIVQLLAEKISGVRLGWMLLASWIAFLIATVSGLLRLAVLGNAAASRHVVFQARSDIDDAINALDPTDPAFEASARRVLNEHIDGALKDVIEAAQAAHPLGWWVLVSFVAGLLGLLIFAAINLPFPLFR